MLIADQQSYRCISQHKRTIHDSRGKTEMSRVCSADFTVKLLFVLSWYVYWYLFILLYFTTFNSLHRFRFCPTDSYRPSVHVYLIVGCDSWICYQLTWICVETDRNHFLQFQPKPKLPRPTCTETKIETEHLISAKTEAETVIFGRSFQECFVYVAVTFRQMTS